MSLKNTRKKSYGWVSPISLKIWSLMHEIRSTWRVWHTYSHGENDGRILWAGKFLRKHVMVWGKLPKLGIYALIVTLWSHDDMKIQTFTPKVVQGMTFLLLLYTDGLFVTSCEPLTIKRKRELAIEFKMKDILEIWVYMDTVIIGREH